MLDARLSALVRQPANRARRQSEAPERSLVLRVPRSERPHQERVDVALEKRGVPFKLSALEQPLETLVLPDLAPAM